MAEPWVYLSPHFDDVVLSVGGLVYEQVQRGTAVEIWTICAGNVPANIPLSPFAQSQHTVWKIGDDVPKIRGREDVAACQMLGAHSRHLSVPDCIYRTLPGTNEPVVKTEQDLFTPNADEDYLTIQVCEYLQTNLPPGCQLAAPLGIGHHRDHILTRNAAEHLPMPLWYYADYPYVGQTTVKLSDWVKPDALEYEMSISSNGLQAWQNSIACYHSQISMFWKSVEDMHTAIQMYWDSIHLLRDDVFLWKY